MKDFEIRCDESRLETTNLIYGKFTLGPFLPGQATTFGNALRRSLLAELSGLAITAFEIIGVMQEFSTLPGLRESILDLSLNLKQIVLTGVLPHSTPPIGFLNVRGPAIIKATDLKLPTGVYCASPNQYIATLGSNGMLHLKFVVSVGKGYSIQPYSIYRSLSKVKLQPASNFDNTGGSKALDYARQVPLESFKDVNLSSKALNPVPLEGKGFTKETPSFLRPPANSKELDVQSKEGLAQLREQEQRSPEEANLSASSYRDNINSPTQTPKGLSYRSTNQKKEELASISEVGGAKSNEGLSYNVEHANAALLERTNFQTVNSNALLTNRNGKDSLISFGHDLPPYSASQIAQREKGGLDDKSKSLNPKGVNLNSATSCNKWQSKEGLVTQRAQEQALSYKASPSTFFTNEKNNAAYPSGVPEGVKALSYLNIQTQLFQRITPHQVLPIDAVFTPVSQVNFLTEVNDHFETARENIVLEIWTNGSIHPKRALEEATLSLVQNFDTLLKKIQQASSFYKGLRYWTYLQPFKSSLGETVNSLTLDSALQAQKSVPNWQRKVTDPEKVKDQKGPSSWQNTERLSAAQTYSQRTWLAGGSEAFEQKGQRLNEDLLVHEGFLLQQHEEDLEEELLEKLFKKDLPQSIYNLDIGNLNLSLQTFLFLKKAKIHTLLQLLTQFSLKQNHIFLRVNSHLKSNLLNKNIIKELNDVIRQFGSED